MNIFSLNFWVQTLLSTFITMVMIYIIKLALNKVNIPIASDIANAV